MIFFLSFVAYKENKAVFRTYAGTDTGYLFQAQ